MNKTQLAKRAGLGRTTVSEAFSPKGAVPSQQTVAALVRALKLSMEELLVLQRTAAENPGTVKADGAGPGRPIVILSSGYIIWPRFSSHDYPTGGVATTTPTPSGSDTLSPAPFRASAPEGLLSPPTLERPCAQ